MNLTLSSNRPNGKIVQQCVRSHIFSVQHNIWKCRWCIAFKWCSRILTWHNSSPCNYNGQLEIALNLALWRKIELELGEKYSKCKIHCIAEVNNIISFLLQFVRKSVLVAVFRSLYYYRVRFNMSSAKVLPSQDFLLPRKNNPPPPNHVAVNTPPPPLIAEYDITTRNPLNNLFFVANNETKEAYCAMLIATISKSILLCIIKPVLPEVTSQ